MSMDDDPSMHDVPRPSEAAEIALKGVTVITADGTYTGDLMTDDSIRVDRGSDGIEGIYGVTEADEVEMGLCACGQGYVGHDAHRVYTLITVPPGPMMDPVFLRFVRDDPPAEVYEGDLHLVHITGWLQRRGRDGEVLILVRGNLTAFQDAITTGA